MSGSSVAKLIGDPANMKSWLPVNQPKARAKNPKPKRKRCRPIAQHRKKKDHGRSEQFPTKLEGSGMTELTSIGKVVASLCKYGWRWRPGVAVKLGDLHTERRGCVFLMVFCVGLRQS